MKIWALQHNIDPPYMSIGIKDKEAAFASPLFYFEGQHLSDSWKILDMEVHGGAGRDLLPDFPFHDHGILCCKSALLEILLPLIENEIEVLRLPMENHDYSLLNVVNVMDVLDKPKCHFELFKSGDVKRIYKYAFREELLKDTYIFKTPELTVTDIYCTDAFRDLVMQHNWTGLKLTQLTPDDERLEYYRTP